MMVERCCDCYYYDKCSGKNPCGYFDPVANADEYEDDRIEKLISDSRDEFDSAWRGYIEEYC
ncbi:MAG: hypothetical protein IJ192_13165 [Clostridia bacterium]|nr:hypothetical protein [Clostridia bacterium]